MVLVPSVDWAFMPQYMFHYSNSESDCKSSEQACKKQSLFKPNIFKCALTFHNFVSTLKDVTGLLVLDVLTIEIAHTYGQTVLRPALDEAEEVVNCPTR